MTDRDLALLLADQRERWRRGDSALVESFFEQCPTLRDSRQQLLDVTYHEIVLRAEYGREADLAEYLKRFPECADDLRQLFEVHAMLAEKETDPDELEAADWPQIPGYEIVDELGRGAMGVVYKSRQAALNRLVALKLVLSGDGADRDELFLFEREAEALGRMKHAHVVQAYDFGAYDGQPFMVMELVEGTTLEEKLRAGPLQQAAAADLVTMLARGVHAAHTHGLIHRDLKPANVLITAEGTPKISDFGLARHVQGDTATTGLVAASSARPGLSERKLLGTPAYMAPEQAFGESAKIGPATDVYALAGILYAALTGRPPQPTSLMDLLAFFHDRRRAPLSQLRPGLDRDLEAICLKSLALEPEQRYASTLELADDLERYRQRLPVVARPVGRVSRGWYWRRRNPLVAALLVLLVLAISGGFAGITAALVEAVNQRDAKDNALGQVRQQAEQLTTANTSLQEALYRSNILVAARAVADGDLPGAEHALAGCAPELRAFEWRYLDRLCHAPGRTWQAPGKDGAKCLAATLDGQTIAAAHRNTIYLLDAATGEVRRKLDGHLGPILRAAFSGDGRHLLTADPLSVIVWDCATGQPETTIKETEVQGQVLTAAFHSQEVYGPRTAEIFIVSQPWPQADKKGQPDTIALRVWDRAMARWARTVEVKCSGKPSAMPSDDGRFLALWQPVNPLALQLSDVRIVDTTTGHDLYTLRGHTGTVHAVAFSPFFNGRLSDMIVTAGADRTARVWDSTGREKFTLLGHRSAVTAIAFSPTGGMIASGGDDRTVRTWETTFGRELTVYLNHARPVSALFLGPNGTPLTAADPAGAVTVWPTPPPTISFRLPGAIYRLALSQTGRRVAGAQLGPLLPAVLFDVDAGQKLREWPGLWSSVALNADGTQLAAAGIMGVRRGEARLWSAATGEETAAISGASMVAYSPDGATLAALTEDAILLCDGRTGVMRRRLTGAKGVVIALAFRADGRQLAAGCGDGRVVVWDVADGRVVATIQTGHAQGVWSLSLSPDGAAVVTCGNDPNVSVWDVATGKVRANWPVPSATVAAVAYSPDGRTLAVAAGDGTVRLWDSHTGEALLTLEGGWTRMTCLAFSGDGNRLAAGGQTDNLSEIRVWDARPLAEGAAAESPAP